MTTRKKPGRPKKRADVCAVGVYGIVQDPSIAGDCVELVYNQPQLLKCIVSIFKEYDSDEIIIEFYPDRVLFIGRDHSLRVRIHITIIAADMNLYYFSRAPMSSSAPAAATSAAAVATTTRVVPAMIDPEDADADADTEAEPNVDADADAADAAEESEPIRVVPMAAVPREAGDPYRIVVKRDNLEIVTAIIEKTHYRLMMALRHDDLSSLFIVLSSCDYESEDQFEISIVPRTDIAPEITEMPNLTLYPLEFTLDSHHLRRKIGELKKVSPEMIIKKVGGDSNLEITFGTMARVVYTGIYKVPARIKLRSSIADGVLFIATMSIGRIRPLMAVNMPGGITFFANNTDPLVIQVGLDQRADNHCAIVARLLINTAH